MSKSIFIFDTPECCDHCPLGRIFGMEGKVECRASEYIKTGIAVSSDGRKIPDWCPLKEIPERVNHPDYCDNGRYDKGWNDCIDEILKGRD